MNKNNKRGKELWVERNLPEAHIVLIVFQNQTKKQVLSEKYGEAIADACQLIDDYEKNTRIFGKNGFLIQSAGDVRLHNFLKKRK